ncbi:hypothetical protein BK640_22630 [Pseudomonas protegens]|nr:hypothetical protein BK639_15995 [Pseudomonas protegens]ROL97146.1 hypothetical protein BK640_22630 [Pseudomonas protegens]ROM00190.1 hypothetical protein BK641_25955 [Pseudomonas protegens]ROM11060.1 hypothetical protein BK642_06340 [Pseudomonas protegens]
MDHDDGRNGAEQDVQFKPGRPIFDVFQVEFDTFFDFFQGMRLVTVVIDRRQPGSGRLRRISCKRSRLSKSDSAY